MKYKTLKALFTGICDAVRTQKGITGEIDHQEIPDEILSIASVDVSGVTATADDVVSPKVFVDANGNEQTGTIPTKSSSDLTANGAQVSVPAGHYPVDVWTVVKTTEQATPSITVDSNGLITAKSTQSEGYVSAGEKSATKQLEVQPGKTVTPTTSEQTAVNANTYTTGAIKVGAIPSDYVKPSGTKSITENGTHDVTSYAAVDVNVPTSGGGGAVETCTVTLSTGTSASDKSGKINWYAYTTYKDGVYEYVNSSDLTGPLTLTDVVKHSTVLFQAYFGIDYVLNGATLQHTITNNYINGLRMFSVDDDNVIIHHYSCFTVGTKIALANGTTKEVQNITYDDELLVWDFDNGCYSSAKPLWIKKEETALSYHHCVFENGIELDLVGSDGNCHAVFCLDDNKFEYANNCVGKMVMTRLGATRLLSCEKRYETVEFYNIITNYHMNCYANDVLTSTTMNNIYPIENMKFVKDDREIVLYEAYSEIPIEFYTGLRLGENEPEKVDELTDKVKKLIKIQK